MSATSLPMTIVLLGIGIASLVISVKDRKKYDEPNCGSNGHPPLRDYLFGTGISYIIIAVIFCAVGTGKGAASKALLCLTMLGNFFLTFWTIIGGIILWRDSKDCQDINPHVWKMGMAAVITSIVLVCCGGATSQQQHQQSGEGKEDADREITVDEEKGNDDDDDDDKKEPLLGDKEEGDKEEPLLD